MTAVAKRSAPSPPGRRFPVRVTSSRVLCALLVLALISRAWLVGVLDVPALRTAATIFVAVCVQAMPFLVLGTLLSGAIAAFVPATVLRRVLPRNPMLAVPVAGLAGVTLPGCECASVPLARRVMQQGVPPAVALTFLLAAPAVNPVVLVATAVAFPGDLEMVPARFLGSLLTATAVGWLWARVGRTEWIAERALRRLPLRTGTARWEVFVETARHDLVEAGGFLVVGGLTAAALQVAVGKGWLEALGGHLAVGIVAMALLAVVLALCSE
ncbi:MAG: permease, partial [Kutzneria sp.]|nr:permease [Kutzneria sp.]